MTYRSSLRMPLELIVEMVFHRFGLRVLVDHIRFGMMSTTVRLSRDTEVFLLKVFNSDVVALDQIAFGAQLCNRLRDSGIPVAELIPTTDGMTVVAEGENLFQLWAFVDGAAFAPGDTTQIEQAGATLGRIHTVGNHMSVPVGQTRASVYESVSRELEQTWRVLDESGDVAPELRRFRRVMGDSAGGRDWEELPRTVIHGDYRAQNLLFRGGRVAAVLDLDTACLATRLWDLAYALAFFQAVVTDGPLTKVEMAAFLRAYDGEAALTRMERVLLPDALRMAVLRGLTLWMRIAYIDRSNDRALMWIRDYWPLYERLERGDAM